MLRLQVTLPSYRTFTVTPPSAYAVYAVVLQRTQSPFVWGSSSSLSFSFSPCPLSPAFMVPRDEDSVSLSLKFHAILTFFPAFCDFEDFGVVRRYCVVDSMRRLEPGGSAELDGSNPCHLGGLMRCDGCTTASSGSSGKTVLFQAQRPVFLFFAVCGYIVSGRG